MITGFAHLYHQTREHVAKVRSVQTSGYVDQTELSRVDNRAIQLCLLDLKLAAHRVKYGSKFEGLSGITALHHKLLIKYQWPISLIKEMSLSDLLIAIHDELNVDGLDPEAKRYFQELINNSYPVTFSDTIEEEWDPNLSAKCLRLKTP